MQAAKCGHHVLPSAVQEKDGNEEFLFDDCDSTFGVSWLEVARWDDVVLYESSCDEVGWPLVSAQPYSFAGFLDYVCTE